MTVDLVRRSPVRALEVVMADSGGRFVSSGSPWWVYLVLILACLAVYICRIIVTFKIASKALDKAPPARVPEIVNSVTGYRSPSVAPPSASDLSSGDSA